VSMLTELSRTLYFKLKLSSGRRRTFYYSWIIGVGIIKDNGGIKWGG
jgi:hypothetical protein